jgi:hypothetical protein
VMVGSQQSSRLIRRRATVDDLLHFDVY